MLDGKEGVDGSSPSEGFAEMPANRLFELSVKKPPVTRGHSRALAGVPSLGASARRIRFVEADPNWCDPLFSPNRLSAATIQSLLRYDPRWCRARVTR
jgi:hypothetical protein